MANVIGGKAIQKRMSQLVGELKGPVTERTLTAAMLVAQSEAALLTPVDTSTLINSAGRFVRATQNGAIGTIYYTADYAAYVHEASGSMKGQPRTNGNGVYWAPNGEPKFLEKGVENAIPEMRRIVLKGYRV